MTHSHDAPDAAGALHVLGALALELSGDAPVRDDRLTQAQAGELAALIAADLATFAPAAAELELVIVGAHYDPVELLRPGWPVHRELDDLAARAPGSSKARVIAFGAHDGTLPGALAPQSDFAGGPLRLVPFVLTGDPDRIAAVGDLFEHELLERGMAGAATALAAQSMFGLQVEHARYLTVHDLAAMTSLQYEHAGLAPLWPVIETALLAPDDEAWLDESPEPLIHYVDGEARIALFSPQAWQQRYAVGLDCTTDDCRQQALRQHRHFEARQRQLAAVLQAHGVVVNFVHCDRANDAVESLA
ncbi:hypothetical protein [Cognatilysobacter terrigena]|uniref:hypothetical protein n=1 Tax=Cognatilysobacter terrigena TaxID=2488749 RepID=UPI00106098BF|nr:hypothetical protein [Lysobacter terrigena]